MWEEKAMVLAEFYQLSGYETSWCKQNIHPFVTTHWLTNTNAKNIRKQLLKYLASAGVASISCGTNTEPIRKAIVSAFFLQAALRQEDGSYRTLVGNKVVVPKRPLANHSTRLCPYTLPLFCLLPSQLVSFIINWLVVVPYLVPPLNRSLRRFSRKESTCATYCWFNLGGCTNWLRTFG